MAKEEKNAVMFHPTPPRTEAASSVRRVLSRGPRHVQMPSISRRSPELAITPRHSTHPPGRRQHGVRFRWPGVCRPDSLPPDELTPSCSEVCEDRLLFPFYPPVPALPRQRLIPWDKMLFAYRCQAVGGGGRLVHGTERKMRRLPEVERVRMPEQ